MSAMQSSATIIIMRPKAATTLPSSGRRWRGAPEDRVPQRGTISAVSYRMQDDLFSPVRFFVFARSFAPAAHSIFRLLRRHLLSKECLQRCALRDNFRIRVPSLAPTGNPPPIRRASRGGGFAANPPISFYTKELRENVKTFFRSSFWIGGPTRVRTWDQPVMSRWLYR